MFQSSQKLGRGNREVQTSVKANAAATPADWTVLARYYEANRQSSDATEAVEKGLLIDPKSVPTLNTSGKDFRIIRQFRPGRRALQSSGSRRAINAQGRECI